jgi:hypothetical protein
LRPKWRRGCQKEKFSKEDKLAIPNVKVKAVSIFEPFLRVTLYIHQKIGLLPLTSIFQRANIFFVAKFEFRVSFGMSLERGGQKLEVTPNLELLVTFGMSLYNYITN